MIPVIYSSFSLLSVILYAKSHLYFFSLSNRKK